MFNFESSLNFESYYVVKPGDNLWMISSHFEITNRGIQQFMNYLLKLNPFLTKKMRKEPGDMIHYRDVIMVHHPDYTYQNFLNGGEPFPTIPMDWQKKRNVESLARNKNLNNKSSLSKFDFETFFKFFGWLNNGLGSIDFDRAFRSFYDIRSKVQSLEAYLNDSLVAAKSGRLSERVFRNNVSGRLKEISDLAGDKLLKAFKSYKKATKSPKSIVGKLAKRTDGKNYFQLPRFGRRSIDMTRTSEIMTSKFEWKLRGGEIVAKYAFRADIILRVGDVIKASVNAKKGEGLSKGAKELTVQSAGFGGSLVAAKGTAFFCAKLIPAGGWPALACGLVVGGLSVTGFDWASKKGTERILDGLFE